MMVSVLVMMCLVLSVESTDSNATVDLFSLARSMCMKNRVRFVRGHEGICRHAKHTLCRDFVKVRSVGKCKLSKSSTLNYLMTKAPMGVCSYGGKHKGTRKVKEILRRNGLCNRFKF